MVKPVSLTVKFNIEGISEVDKAVEDLIAAIKSVQITVDTEGE